VEILLWLVPPVLVTLVAMAWVGWVGREGRGEVDRDEAVRRLGEALERDTERPARAPHLPRRGERSTGVALRRTPPEPPPAAPPLAAVEPVEPADGERRRAG
jgi:hypothetical protein